uniref:Uncharacterized protein n=1 Tax=Panagrolaimus sp. JU765 TaxID=591449 RepID=A0AC34QY93_9BILA
MQRTKVLPNYSVENGPVKFGQKMPRGEFTTMDWIQFVVLCLILVILAAILAIMIAVIVKMYGFAKSTDQIFKASSPIVCPDSKVFQLQKGSQNPTNNYCTVNFPTYKHETIYRSFSTILPR